MSRPTVIQFPNKELVVALVAALLARVTHGIYAAAFHGIFYFAIAAWSYLEITTGVNLWRKSLGAVVMAYCLVSLTRQLA